YAYVKGDPINHNDPSGRDVNDDAGNPGPIPDPGQTPPFGCDLFGGCVPGCLDITYGGGYYFWPGPGPMNPCPPKPPEVEPSSPPVPACWVEVWSQPAGTILGY